MYIADTINGVQKVEERPDNATALVAEEFYQELPNLKDGEVILTYHLGKYFNLITEEYGIN